MAIININRDVVDCSNYSFENTTNSDVIATLEKYNGVDVNNAIVLIPIFEETIPYTVNYNSYDNVILSDGIYKLTQNSSNETQYFVVDCTMQECKIKYLNAILSCNQTNCTEEIASQNKLHYNFAVISELSRLFEILCSDLVVQGIYTTNPSLTPEQVQRFIDLDKILERFSAYCQDCIEPCKNCN